MRTRSSCPTPCTLATVIALSVAVSLANASLHADHPLPGPHVFTCQELEAGVLLSWDELGLSNSHIAALYREEDRDDDAEFLGLLEPDSRYFLDADIPEGQYTYFIDISIIDGKAPSNVTTCDVTLGEEPTLQCEVFGGIAVAPEVLLNWTSISGTAPVEAILIDKDGETVAELPGDAGEYQEEPTSGEHEYVVTARFESAPDSKPIEWIVGRCLAVYDPPVIGGLVRGDCNQDGSHDISDAVCVLRVLFIGDMPADCLQSLDVDDDGEVQITDSVVILNFLFQGGAPIAQPFPDCGHDNTSDGLSCELFPRCFNPPPP